MIIMIIVMMTVMIQVIIIIHIMIILILIVITLVIVTVFILPAALRNTFSCGSNEHIVNKQQINNDHKNRNIINIK